MIPERKRTKSPQHESLADGDEAVKTIASAMEEKPWLGSGIILTWFAIAFSLICVTSFLQKSPTVDEPEKILGGYTYLKWGDFRIQPEHPPLAKLWAALPLLTLDIKDPRERPQWNLIAQTSQHRFTSDLARDMLSLDNDAERLFFFAKLQMIGLAILLGCFVYRWSKELFSYGAALVALFVYGLDPNILAHSQIVHTDVPLAAFFFIATYYFWRSLNRFDWTNATLSAVFFGLTVVTKYSYLSIVLSWVALGVFHAWRSEPQQWSIGKPRLVTSRLSKFGLCAILLVYSAVVAYFFIWAVYGFRFHAIPAGNQILPFAEVAPESVVFQKVVRLLTEFHLFPEAWIYGQLYVLQHLTRRMYFLGEISNDGFWSYFPITFLVKTPVPTILLVAVAAWVWGRKSHRLSAILFLVIPAAVYFCVAVVARLNIGLRHILPVYPFLFVLIGGTVAAMWQENSRVKKSVLVFLGAWYLWSSLGTYPHYLAFFNELVGGPKNGDKITVDSNLDWGQDLKGLKRWMEKHQVEKIQFAYFGTMDPEVYGIDVVDIPGHSFGYVPPAKRAIDAPKYLAISATYVRAYQDQPLIKALRSREPAATIGYSIYVYEMD